MSDKYINLSLEEAFELLAHWRSASTRLSLNLIDNSSSFKGTVRIMGVWFPLTVHFTWVFDFPSTERESVTVSMVGAELLRVSLEEPRRWFACRCESGLRFVLEVLDDNNPILFDLESMLEH
jgi:hypothetical protein